MKDEELVRKVWPEMSTYHRDLDSYGTDQFRIYLRQSPCKWPDDSGYLKMFQEDDTLSGRKKAWSEAATYTRAHLEKVRQKREEIAWMKDAHFYTADLEIAHRILSLLEAQLAELESGLTDWAKAHVEELLKEH